jgi:hypothetical protein
MSRTRHEVVPPIVAVIVLCGALCGCSLYHRPDTGVDYHVGADGVVISVIANSAASRVYADTEVEVALQMENRGAYDLADASAHKAALVFLSYDPKYLNFMNENLVGLPPGASVLTHSDRGEAIVGPIGLLGKSVASPTGDREVVQLPFYVRNLSGQETAGNVNLLFSSCFTYETNYAAEVCMDADSYSIDARRKVCKSAERSASSQGGPIAITRIVPRMIKEEGFLVPAFEISVRNVGGGTVFGYDPDGTQTLQEICTSGTMPTCVYECQANALILDKNVCKDCRLQHPESDVLHRALLNATLSGVPLDCGGAPTETGLPGLATIHFTDNEASVRCSVRSQDRESFPLVASNYVSNLAINVMYAYKVSTSSRMTISP